jgi:methylated-DNA-protein-cysteine methyltransferase-like protein
MNFNERVYRVVSWIPRGRVLGYAGVASLLGSPRAARQVGWALSALENDRREVAARVPWHRVIRSSGQIALQGEPGRGLLQRALLEEEGVLFNGDRVDMRRFCWDFLREDLLVRLRELERS